MSFPSIAAALTEDDGNGSDFSDADHHDEGLPMEVSLRLQAQAKDSLAAPESPRSKTTEAAEAKLAVAKAKLDAARLERSRRLIDTPSARPKKRKSLAAKALKKAKNGIRHSANAAKEAVTKKAVVARHFKPKLVLGAGAFGTVLLVKKRTGFTRGKLYAMKVMAKADTSAKMAKVERDVLSRAKVYMVMQFIDGSCLEAQQTALLDCDDPKAAIQFVAAELTLGLVHLHLAGIIHHDIKPANCLVRHDGHLFICDFGLATLTEGKRDCGFKPAKLQDKACVAVKKGFQGTVPYSAPEVLQKTAHVSSAVDYWALGVLLYELYHGRTPFDAAKARDMFANILFKQPAYDESRVDAAARTFLGRLLSKDVKARHGVDSPPCDCVDEADFCDRFESDALMRRWYDDAPPSPRSDQRNYELMAFEFTHASHKSLSLSDGLDDPNRGESDETTLDAIDTFGRLTSPSQKDVARKELASPPAPDKDLRRSRSSSSAYGGARWFGCLCGLPGDAEAPRESSSRSAPPAFASERPAAARAAEAPPRSAESAP
ncbi:hypothetical protein JL721_6395 [Aureococcus anophagefferens]|nr:hypothetical protein JL721_6395 [Aureococcus anophagefferens]